MRPFAIREQFPLLRTSLLKMHNFSMFPADPKRNFCQLLGKRKNGETYNCDFENSSPHKDFGEKNREFFRRILDISGQ